MPVMVLSSLERYALVQMVTKAQLLVLVFGCISFLRSSPPFPLCLPHFSITWIEMGMLLLTSEWLCEQNGYYNHMHLLLLSTVWLLDSACILKKNKISIIYLWQKYQLSPNSYYSFSVLVTNIDDYPEEKDFLASLAAMGGDHVTKFSLKRCKWK